jgi:capsular exopolysaccharide synthesis family protein
VGRIDDALRRHKPAQIDGAVAGDSQHLFMPAWPETPEETEVSTDAAGPGAGRKNRVVRFASEWRERLAMAPDGDPALIEQFRRLAATLHHAQLNSGLRSVMVTSARPGDGKTLTSINLALVLAESYRYNVLLIDADLRRPSIPNVVEIGGGQGLGEALRSPTEQKLALLTLSPRLTLLPAGQPMANSIEALTSPRMRQILQEAIARFDWVILDAPPVGPTTDARLLAQMVGGTLFVLRAGQTPCVDVQKAVDAIGREQVLGVVLNGVDQDGHSDYYGAGAPVGTD